jgi:hypothetical protein
MADPIPPALTAEEWAAAYARETDASLGFHPLHTELVQAADFGRYAQAAALANAALPDGDPRKLTHEDLEELRDLMQPGSDAALRHAETQAALGRITAKLAALLPPRGTR